MPEGAGGEKTEKATPRKREEARKEGRVLKSVELTTGVMTMALFAVLGAFGASVSEQWTRLIRICLEGTSFGADRTAAWAGQVFWTALGVFALAALPVAAAAVLVGLVVNYAQVGFLLTAKPLVPKFSKLNPLEGFKRLFSLRSFVELIKSILKVAVVGYFVYLSFRDNLAVFPNLMRGSLQDSVLAVYNMCFGLAIRAAAALVLLGLADYVYQWFDYEKSLRMSKQEVKDEYKLTEGSPDIKNRIRQKQREVAQSRMMAAVPQADVVVTNPTHYAVALKYDEAVADAPVVIAKGQNLVAQRIKEVARQNNIPTVENKPVAQALYMTVEVGHKIPSELFAAVAEILAYIYRLKHPKPAARAAVQSPADRPASGREPLSRRRGEPAMSNVRSVGIP